MKHFKKLLVAAIGALSLIGAGSATVLAHESRGLLEFDSMTAVTGAAVGAVNARGITGGGLPWVIKSGRGTVDSSGEVEVRVKGLIIVVPPVNGKNPVPTFRATVSCLTPGGVVNKTTKPFPASSDGDATIEDTVALPQSCHDPIVFVVNGTASASGGFAWFAMSNSEEDED